MQKRSEMDLTTGNLFWKTPLFVLPLMMTTIFQLLYTTVDLWTVSKFGGGPSSMSAIGSNTALINLIITVLVSLATGANVGISVAKGANDKEKASNILHTAFIVAIIGGVIIGLFGFFAAPTFLKWMDTPALIIDEATQYLKVYFLGVPLLMIYNYGSQMLRALGDSKRPLYILIISGLINVGFDFIFVYFAKLNVIGVALATVISEAISATLTILWFIFNKNGFVRLSLSKLKVNKRALKSILRIGLPAGLQGVAFSFPNLLIQSSLYTIVDYSIAGVAISQGEIVAGASAAAQIEGYAFAMIDSFAVGCVSMAGQNYGALSKKNIKKSFWYCQTWMLIFWLIALIICLTMPYALLSIFINDSSNIVAANALAAGKERLFLMIITYGLDGIMDVDGCYLRGLKRSTPPAIITLIGCTGTRILFLLTLFKTPYFHTIFWLYAAYPISWILVDLVYIPVIIIINKKVFKRVDEKIIEANIKLASI